MTDFVLVPGAWHGGWWYAPVVEALEGKGHRAHAVTLAGLADDDVSESRPVTLDTHIDQLGTLVVRARPSRAYRPMSELAASRTVAIESDRSR